MASALKRLFGFVDWKEQTPNSHTVSYKSTNRMQGRTTMDFHDTTVEKKLCGFLEIFKNYSRNPLVDDFVKCTVKSNTPYLQFGEKSSDCFPVDSASITSLHHDDGTPGPSELEFFSKGRTYSLLALPNKIVFSEIVKHPLSTYCQKLRDYSGG